jgi:hypothetical protein
MIDGRLNDLGLYIWANMDARIVVQNVESIFFAIRTSAMVSIFFVDIRYRYFLPQELFSGAFHRIQVRQLCFDEQRSFLCVFF